MRGPLMLALLPLLAGGCKDKDETPAGDDTGDAWRPALVCPGDAGCESLGDGVLYAGAAARTITPTCFESWEDLDSNGSYDRNSESFFDCGCDRLCPGDDGYTSADTGEGDGVFQAVYMAGFGMNRPVRGVHDDLWARAVAIRQGDLTFAVVSVDLVGVFYDDILLIREAAAAAGVDVDHIVLSSTHNHEGPDSLGQWGKQLGQTGYDPVYMQNVRDTVVAAVAEAVDGLAPASLRVGQIDISTYDAEKGSRNIVYDHRDPKIIDRFINTARLTDASSGQTIATVVNYGNHPEALGGDNTLITSDYVQHVREGVEQGVSWPKTGGGAAGVGGVCVFVSGAVGGMMSPLRIEVTDGNGDRFSEASFEKAQALGLVIAELALRADAAGEDVADPALALRTANLRLPIDNVAFQAAFLMGMLDRRIYNVDTGEPLAFDDDDVIPEVLTEIDVLDLGPVRMLTIPGEILPELVVGGYDPADGQPFTSLEVMVDESNPNPPDLSAAPPGPYIADRLGAPYNWIVGLGNDELGYIIPSYNFQLHESTPYIQDAEGDHYEETNSLGPETAPLLEAAVIQLLEWSP